MLRSSEMSISMEQKGQEKGSKLQKTFNSIFQCLKDQNFGKIYALRQKQTLDKSLRQFFCNLADLCKRYMHLVKIYEQVIEQSGDIESINISKLQQSMVKYEISKEDCNKIEKSIEETNSRKKEKARKLLQQKIFLQKQLRAIKTAETELMNRQKQALKIESDHHKQMAQLIKGQLYQKTLKFQQLQNQNGHMKEEKKTLVQKVEAAQAELYEIKNRKPLIRQETKEDQTSLFYFEYFMDKTYLLNQIGLNPSAATAFVDHIEKIMHKNVKGFNHLYRYDQHLRADIFHQQVDRRPNILLICKTKENKILGGFTSCPFDITKTQHSQNQLKNQQAFLFNIDKQGLNVFPLRYGFQSIEYDFDFIIFGADELSLCRRTAEVTSQFCTNIAKRNYYQDPKNKRVNFLSDLPAKAVKIELVAYEIISVIF